MGGATFGVTGSTGQAPNTVWFGKVPDKLNMMMPGHDNAGTLVIDSISAANYMNQWAVGNASLGAFTTAPDGTTNTAQLLVEDNTTNIHRTRGMVPFTSAFFCRLRLAGYFKAGPGRTRIGLMFGWYGGNAGVRAVFDLAGGQIGVPAATFGSPQMFAYQAQIQAAGNGWYLCILEGSGNLNGSGSQHMLGRIFIDSGTGTGALSDTYLGDGVSGIYGWKTNLMPTAAYGLNNRTFFDDFNSLSTVDLTNSKAPGFNWYIEQNWTGYDAPPNFVVQASQLSVASSVLTFTVTPGQASELWSFGRTGPLTGGVGGGYTVPALFECRASWTDAAGGVSFWGTQQEFLYAVGASPPYPFGGAELYSRELDFIETQAGGSQVDVDIASAIFYFPGGSSFQSSGHGMVGIPPWKSWATYNGGSVSNGGNFYTSIAASTNDPPPSANWRAYTNYDGGLLPVLWDPTVMHTYSTLWIPYVGPPVFQANAGSPDPDFFNGIGMVISFMDGIFAGVVSTYTPCQTFENSVFMHLSDRFHQVLTLQTAVNCPLSVDWVSVIQ